VHHGKNLDAHGGDTVDEAIGTFEEFTQVVAGIIGYLSVTERSGFQLARPCRESGDDIFGHDRGVFRDIVSMSSSRARASGVQKTVVIA
jgi:hypothetical protein